MLTNILLLVGITLMYSTPLTFGALGGVISERSGVVNIGIEGMMTIGALAGAATSYFTGNPWLAFLVAGIAGGLLALLHAIASVTFLADQNVSGIALNLLGPGLALFFARLFWNGGTQSPSIHTLPKLFGESAFQGTPWANLNVDVTVLLGLIATLIVWFVLYRTKWGLRVPSASILPPQIRWVSTSSARASSASCFPVLWRASVVRPSRSPSSRSSPRPPLPARALSPLPP